VYVCNESPQDVYFDNITVKHFTGPLLQEQSYYPFGVEMAAISYKAMNKLSSAYKFNGDDEMEESISLYSTFYMETIRKGKNLPINEEFSSIKPFPKELRQCHPKCLYNFD
jgi:hypothetical protein